MSRGTAIWVYGSSARGDGDDLSDLDVLVVGPMRSSIVTMISRMTSGDRYPSISSYSWREIRVMAGYGSLFLHHLRLEAYPLHEDDACRGRLRQTLVEMGRYTRASKDVSAFRAVLHDVEKSLIVGDLVVFELSVLATVIRHASILGCWLLGEPRFGRIQPVEWFSSAADVLDHREFEKFPELYAYRLHFDERVSRLDLLEICPTVWLCRAYALVEALEEMISVHSDGVFERH